MPKQRPYRSLFKTTCMGTFQIALLFNARLTYRTSMSWQPAYCGTLGHLGSSMISSVLPCLFRPETPWQGGPPIMQSTSPGSGM